MSAATAIPETLASVTSFLGEKHGLLIGGRWMPAASDETFAAENPRRRAPLPTSPRAAPRKLTGR
jgi:hypothetical protein